MQSDVDITVSHQAHVDTLLQINPGFFRGLDSFKLKIEVVFHNDHIQCFTEEQIKKRFSIYLSKQYGFHFYLIILTLKHV